MNLFFLIYFLILIALKSVNYNYLYLAFELSSLDKYKCINEFHKRHFSGSPHDGPYCICKSLDLLLEPKKRHVTDTDA